jgi:hypothetical protein
VADHADRLARLEEGTHEAHRPLVGAKVIGADGAARHDQGIVVVGRDVSEGLLHRESLARVDVAVHGLGLAGLDA